jgi:hypothetical protein
MDISCFHLKNSRTAIQVEKHLYFTTRFFLDQCSAAFFHPWHTLICQRHMKEHHKMSPHEKGVRNYTGP